MPAWLLALLRVVGIRSAADVVPVATEIAHQVRDVVDPPEPGQPLSHADVRHIEAQRNAATSHKVRPAEPRTGNPARVVAASAPGRPAPFASPPEGGGAAGTQGAGPGIVKAVDRSIITPREGVRIVPPRPAAPRKEPKK